MANNQVTIQVVANVEDGEVQNLDQLIEDIKSEAVNVPVEVEDGEIQGADAEIENLNKSVEVDIDVNDAGVQTAMQNINDGINQAKQGIGDLSQGFMTVMTSAGQQETNFAFLKNAVGDADKAKEKMEGVNQVVQDLPGDDTALQGLLSSAVAKDASLTTKELESMGTAATDYFSAMSYYGKSSTEAQQDMTNYILAGNTAELERSPILQGHIDKLKEANTIQERSKVLQEALNKEHWGGMSQQDTYNNKLATFEGMIDRGRYKLGGMFQEGAKGAMDLVMGLDDATGGVTSMAIAFATQFGPGIASIGQGILTVVPGIKALGGLSGIMGTLSSGVSGLATSFLGLSVAGAPLWAIIAAVVALGVAIYEVGKYFGWWNDLPGMFGAIQAGVMSLWNAFMSNEYVIQAIDLIKQGLTDAWNAIVAFGQAIMTALGGAGGEFDILSWAINGLQTVLAAVGPVVVWYLQTMISNFRYVYSVAQAVWPYVGMAIQSAMSTASNIIATARGAFQGLIGIWNACSGAVQSMASAIQGALDAAGSAWQGFQSTVMSVVQPIIDKINELKSAASNIPGIGGLFSGGIETPTVSTGGGYGSGPTTVSQGNTIIFNMYGDIRDEKTLDETIDAINNRIQFDALANGVTTTDNGSGAI